MNKATVVVYLLVMGALSPSFAMVDLSKGWKINEGYEHGTSKLDAYNESWRSIDMPTTFTEIESATNEDSYLYLARPLPKSIMNLLKADKPVAYRTPNLSDVSGIYLNGNLITVRGNFPPNYEPGIGQNHLSVIPARFYNKGSENILSILLYRDNQVEFGAAPGAGFFVGKPEEVFWQYYSTELVQFALIALYILTGAYHLVLASKRPQDKYNFFFSFFCFVISAYFLQLTDSRTMLYGNNQELRAKLELSILFTAGPLLLGFLSQFFERKNSRLVNGLIIWSLLLIILVNLSDYKIAWGYILPVWQFTALVMLIYMVYYVVKRVLQKNKDAMYLLGGIVIFKVGVISDILAAQNLIDMPKIAQFTFLTFILGIAFVLSNYFMRLHNQVEELNTNLEKKVEKRTEELKQTLSEVQALKVQQDGDYFLTSLLLKPLGVNHVNSANYTVDFFLKQKKEFSFRKYERDIGGDINIAHNITLGGKPHLVVLNGDAMGKSIQGAGGALVLGAIFQSIIERTRISEEEQEKPPERWLKNTFVELHKVFESFDGSMLMSLVILVIEERTGILYYLNAEHPFTILYRDEKAEFLETETNLRKLGTTGVEGLIKINLFQLEDGDKIIAGSDGRDDVLLGFDEETGARIINEDETKILEILTDTKGELEPAFDELKKLGEVTDDTSLISLDFHPGKLLWKNCRSTMKDIQKLDNIPAQINAVKEEYDLNPNPLYLQELAKLNYKNRNLQQALNHAVNANEEHCLNTDFLYFTSYLAKLSKKYDIAAHYGERVYLRSPDNKNNLMNLVDIYLLTGNLSRVKKLLVNLDQSDKVTVKLNTRYEKKLAKKRLVSA